MLGASSDALIQYEHVHRLARHLMVGLSSLYSTSTHVRVNLAPDRETM